VAVTDPRLHAAASHLLPDGVRYVGFATGAGGKEKIWPLERFLALAKSVEARGDRAVFFVGPEEQGDLAAICAAMPNALLPEWDRSDPFQDVKGPLLAVALSARLAAGVSNDSGIGHALALGGAPLLSLQITSRKARKFRPAATRLEMLIAETFGGGMEAIPLEAAAEKLDLLLTEQR
jgi:ADP-heptose:LPS heptosyltransferase